MIGWKDNCLMKEEQLGRNGVMSLLVQPTAYRKTFVSITKTVLSSLNFYSHSPIYPLHCMCCVIFIIIIIIVAVFITIIVWIFGVCYSTVFFLLNGQFMRMCVCVCEQELHVELAVLQNKSAWFFFMFFF